VSITLHGLLPEAEITGRPIDIGQGHWMGIGPIIGFARSLDRAQDSDSNGIELRNQSESGTCSAANGPKRKCSRPCPSTRESFLADVEEKCS